MLVTLGVLTCKGRKNGPGVFGPKPRYLGKHLNVGCPCAKDCMLQAGFPYMAHILIQFVFYAFRRLKTKHTYFSPVGRLISAARYL